LLVRALEGSEIVQREADQAMQRFAVTGADRQAAGQLVIGRVGEKCSSLRQRGDICACVEHARAQVGVNVMDVGGNGTRPGPRLR